MCRFARHPEPHVDLDKITCWPAHTASAGIRKDNHHARSMKRRLARGIGAALAAAAASATLSISAASASSGGMPGRDHRARQRNRSTRRAGGEPGGPQRGDRRRNGPGRPWNSSAFRATHSPTRSPGAASAPRPRRTSTPASGAWTDRSSCRCSRRLARRMASRPAPSRSPTRPCSPRCAPTRVASTPTCTPPSSRPVRHGDLHLLNHAVSTSGVAALADRWRSAARSTPVPAQPDGSFAFTQDNVNAHLTDDIHHTFVQPVAPTAMASTRRQRGHRHGRHQEQQRRRQHRGAEPRRHPDRHVHRTAGARCRSAPPQHTRRRRPGRIL